MRYRFLATRELNVCEKFPVRSSRTVTATLRTSTVHKDREVKEEKPGANQSTSQSSVPVSIQYRFGKQYSLVISTGL